jgi:hypothetical protein
VGVHRADGQVLGHPLDEPQWQQQRGRAAEAYSSLPREAGYIELKCVHELVPEHVVRLVQRAREGKHDPSFQDFRDTARGFAELPEHCVRLLEVRVAGVQDQGLLTVELVVQETAYASVPSFGHATGLADDGLHLGIVIDVEVLGLEHLRIESLVLDLVAAEVLGIRGRRQDDRAQQQRQKKEKCPRS